MTSTLSQRDWEALSAYLDNQLEPRERARLEARLAAEPALKAGLRELDQTRVVLRSLPPVRAPRNFTLTPEMAADRQPFIFRLFPVFQSAAVVATVLFALVYTLSFTNFVTIGSVFDRAAEPALLQFEADAPQAFMAEPEVVEEAAEAVGGAVEELEQEKSIIPAEELPEEVPAAAEGRATAPEAGLETEPTLEASMALPSADMIAETEVGEAAMTLEEPMMEAMEAPVITPSPSPTFTPPPALEPTATVIPTPRPTPTPIPDFVEYWEQNPISIPAVVLWALGGIAFLTGALTIFLRIRQP